MASSNVLGVQDAYAIINSIAAQALGAPIQVVDSSSFVTVGEMLLNTAPETTMNAISYVLGRTIFSIRPYNRKLSTLERDEERFGMITRKITYLVGFAEETEDFNTQVDGSRLADGQSVDMYKIKAPKEIQLSFPGAQSLQDHITRFRNQLRLAFSNETEFLRFWEGAMVQFYNMLELRKEAKSRAVLCNRIAGQVAMNVGVVDLVYEFNSAKGTSYNRAQLLNEYAEDFWKFVAARIQNDSDKLTEMSIANHASLDGYDPIPRHTPKDRQRMFMYNPAYNDARAQVWSSLFNPQYLGIGNFEGVNFWQSQADPSRIDYVPSILNTSSGEANAAGSHVEIPYVLGILHDEEALGVMPKWDYGSATPENSAGGYWNFYVHWLFKMYNDYTENAIVYVLGDVGSVKLSGLICQIGGVSSLSPSFNEDVLEYTASGTGATILVSAAVSVPDAIINVYKDGTYIPNARSTSLDVGTSEIKIEVKKAGYAPTTYTITATRGESKDGGDTDEKTEEPAAETKAAKSTKTTK